MPQTPFNLIREAWLPVRRADGSCDRITPSGIVTDLSNNPVLVVDWPRADFNGATLEFLIGLLATAFPPKDKNEWLERWENPAAPADLDRAFERVAFAFDLDGDNPRFMQEFGDLEGGFNREIAALLIEQPGQQTIERNADHFIKHGTTRAISRATAAIGLFTMQTYSPAGGRGYLTSIRGGGPLTTLVAVDPRDGESSLWQLLWSNVPEAAEQDWVADPTEVFPWLAATRTSRTFPVTTPEHGHPLQAFWGMPRRIRLIFEAANGRICDLGSPDDNVLAVGWKTRQYGIKYEGWIHPLSPYGRPKSNGLPKAVKANSGKMGYRHWLGVVQEDPDNDRFTAHCVKAFRNERAQNVNIAGIRVIAFGYDMDKMKARCWCQREMPVPNVSDINRETFDEQVTQVVWATNMAADMIRSAVKRALLAQSAGTQAGILLQIDRLWRDTEFQFLDLLNELARGGPYDPVLLENWLNTLRRTALATFDAVVSKKGHGNGAWTRLVEARKSLARELNGKDIRVILGLAPQRNRTKQNNAMAAESADIDIGAVARTWWLNLNKPTKNGGRDQASLAVFKRSADPIDIALVPAFGCLQHGIGAYSERALKCTAKIAHVLAHVREDDRCPVARALGHYRGNHKPLMSEARFRRLVKAHGNADLTRRLVRAVKILKGKANVADLASAVWRWDDSTRQKWVLLYPNTRSPFTVTSDVGKIPSESSPESAQNPNIDR